MKIKNLSDLTPYDVIMAMVEGLKNPKTKVDMTTFGHKKGYICYGCAATNAICHLFELDPMDSLPDQFSLYTGHSLALNERYPDIQLFELAIDNLRRGYIDSANDRLHQCGIAPIKQKPGLYLLQIMSDYTHDQLEPYIELANFQKETI